MAGGRTVTGPARAHGTRHGGRRWRRPSGRSVRSSTGRLSDRSATSFRHRAVPALRPLSPSPRAEGPWSKSVESEAGWGGHRRMTGDGGGLLRGNLLDGPASPQGSWTSPACAGTSWTLGTRSHADRPPRPGCTGGSPRPEPAEGRQQGPKAADPRRVGPAAGGRRERDRAGQRPCGSVSARERPGWPPTSSVLRHVRYGAISIRPSVLATRALGPNDAGAAGPRSPGQGRSAPGPAPVRRLAFVFMENDEIARPSRRRAGGGPAAGHRRAAG